MKRFLTVLAAASAVLAVYSCKESGKIEPQEGPNVEWPSNPDFSIIDITDDLDAKIRVTAPAGIRTFVVTVCSAELEGALKLIGIESPELDLINDAQVIGILDAVTGGALPTGSSLLDQTSVDFDITSLVGLILPIAEAGTEHSFRLDVSDNNAKSITRTCIFRVPGEPAPEDPELTLTDVDLWANTAVVNIEDAASVEYRVKGSSEWVSAEQQDGRYMIAPVWEEATNEAGLTVYRVKEETGLFAGNTYEFRVNGQDFSGLLDYTAAAGDAIPNGDMSGWTTIGGTDKPLPYPNSEGSDFWTSGNNVYCYPIFGDGEPDFLCSEEEGAAKLQANKVLGTVFACGNMFTGSFSQEGTAGAASFGQQYEWSARPKALRVRVKVTVGIMDSFGPGDPDKEELEASMPVDKARIYAVAVNWSDRHVVKSGLGVESSELNAWDPATMTSVEEGGILGYASMFFDESIDDYTVVEIPFEWYDTVSKPESGKYSIVISCATSYRGDYLTGCSANKLWVDDFEWVY